MNHRSLLPAVLALTTITLAVVGSTLRAAKAPISQENRIKESSHVVTALVTGVTSKVEKSKIEKGIGNRDEIFSIDVKVESSEKGEGIKVGDEITIKAWKPRRRIGLASVGLQGQESIPKKGDRATFYVKKEATIYEALMPNGIDIDKSETPQGGAKTKTGKHPYELADQTYYKPVAKKKDAGGLVIAGENSSEAIRKCKSINGLTIAELEKRMRPENLDKEGSVSGFLGADESLLEVMANDNDFVLEQGLSHRELAIPLLQITNRAIKLGLRRPVEFEHAGIRWKAKVEATRGYQYSPFEDGTKTQLDVELTNLQNNETLQFSGLVPLMVERYGFYEGKGTPYRVEPAQIIKVLSLSSKDPAKSSDDRDD